MGATPHVARSGATGHRGSATVAPPPPRVRPQPAQAQACRAVVRLDEDRRRPAQAPASRWTTRRLGLHLRHRGLQHRPLAPPATRDGSRLTVAPAVPPPARPSPTTRRCRKSPEPKPVLLQQPARAECYSNGVDVTVSARDPPHGPFVVALWPIARAVARWPQTKEAGVCDALAIASLDAW